MDELRDLFIQSSIGSEGEETASNNERERKLDKKEERMRRLEVPYFYGDDPYGWIYRIERYFEINSIPEEEKVLGASICFEGKALNWLQWWEARRNRIIWGNLRRALLGRFQDAMSENPYEVLRSLKQTTFVAEFIEKSELISSPLHHADEEMLKSAFMNGLKEEIRVDVHLHGIDNLGSTMKLARKVEEKNKALGCGDGPGKKFGSVYNSLALNNRWDGSGNGSNPNRTGNRSHGSETNTHVRIDTQGNSTTIVQHHDGSQSTGNRSGSSF